MNSPAPAGLVRVPDGTRTSWRNPSSMSAPGATGADGVKTQRPARSSTLAPRGFFRRASAADSRVHSSPSNVNARSRNVVFGVTANWRMGASFSFRRPYEPFTRRLPSAGSRSMSRSMRITVSFGASFQVLALPT